MHHIKVSDGIVQLSANAEPNSLLFESMWPIPHGVSMNSYIVKGERTAIIDGFCGWDGVPETLFKLLDAIEVELEAIDYVVINHMEPDHAGWLENFKKLRPNFRVVATAKAEATLAHYMGMTDEYHVVKSGDEIDLGGGKRLRFYETPNVHWPETMMTYEVASKTLFSCDGFGMFGSVPDEKRYDDDLSEEEMAHYVREMVRYYANIVGAFSYPVQKAIKNLGDLDVQLIAPGHGLMWRNPSEVVNHYARLASYSKGPARPKATIIWGSMYGATEMAVEPLASTLRAEGLEVAVHRVPQEHISYILQSVWESSAVAIGMPTYEYKMFPAMHATLDEIFKKKTLNRKAFYFGSYGWSGGAQKELTELVERSKCKWEFLESVEFQGRPTADDIARLQQRGRELAAAAKEWKSSAVV